MHMLMVHIIIMCSKYKHALVCTLYLFLAQNSLVVCTIFPRVIAVPQLIASVEYSQPPPTPTSLAFFSFVYPIPAKLK